MLVMPQVQFPPPMTVGLARLGRSFRISGVVPAALAVTSKAQMVKGIVRVLPTDVAVRQ